MITLTRPECPNPEALANGNYKDPINKEALRQSTAGKCMYCESKIEHNSYAHVEHIKPKKKFPELELVCDNLGFCCPMCNIIKGDKYDENTPFINPYNENPEDHIVFFGYYVRRSSERGEYTINELGLNRDNLVEDRKDKFEKLNIIINAASSTSNESLRIQAIAVIKKEADKDKEYSGMVKSVLLAQGILE
jgi:flagellum-specific peptidoglycan hydrolase FlgJ